ncbi:hypothetical protein KUTeg_001242 [Tegillarca granosa]|uniref:Uncharacterized protein n=1 Tax=Tegillarca granosa TaxID=220873 RepID=A0ABQ9FVF4_TEGGR|nr:hypothetical protein KUTeg_001242 [Tegillarca granosa]
MAAAMDTNTPQWSLELLGRISGKYTHYQGILLANSLNELLQQWMMCKPTKSLIEVSTECFAAISCFPTAIITRVLMCGLKDFCQHSKKSPDNEMMSEEKIPKMGSVDSLQTDINPSVLNKLSRQFQSWKTRSSNEFESFLGMVVLLVMRTENGALHVLNFLLDTASPLQISDISDSCDESLNQEVKDTCAVIVLTKFIQLQINIEVRLGDILPSTSQRLTDLLGPDGVQRPLQLLQNIFSLIKWEKASKVSPKQRSSLTYSLQAQWKSFIPLITHDSREVAILTLRILNEIGVPKNLTMDAVLQLCSSLVLFFFQILDTSDSKIAFSMFKVCHHCVHNICGQSYIQCILIRFIIEGVFNQEVGKLLGAKSDPAAQSAEKKPTVSLLEENKKHGLTLTLPRSHSSVFHAGVIGGGLRPRINMTKMTKDHVTRNKLFVTDLLRICSHQQQKPEVAMEMDMEHQQTPPSKNHQLILSEDLCRMVGSLLTELSTPDVLYNNRFWPEEESIRMTVERDLQVWKCFDNNPVIWDIMELYGGNSLAMCRCSPVLKSITAALMNHFESCREELARNSPKQMTAACRLVRCLGKSCLLPEPLKFVSELFPLVTSYEAFLLLLTVWRYMKENPPTEDPEEARRRGNNSVYDLVSQFL